MKKIILLFCILGSFTSVAQKKNSTINWATVSEIPVAKKKATSSITKNPSQVKSTKQNVSSSKQAHQKSKQNALDYLKLTLSKEKVLFQDQWLDTGFANPSSLAITNVKYASVSNSEFKNGYF